MNARTPLNYTITHAYDGLAISPEEGRRLFDIASWNGLTPTFTRRGRGAWELLAEPAAIARDPAVTFHAAKLKGVGLWNPRRPDDSAFSNKLHDLDGDAPVPPLTDVLEYLVTYPHFGIGEDGEYKFAYSSASPVGGIVHERAHREYWAAERLIEFGVPSVAPFAVVEYDESLRFQGQPMGAVITLSPGAAPYRISEVLFGAGLARGSDPGFDAHYDAMREALGIEGDPDDERVRLRVICALAREAGELLHDFSLAELYRYSGDWGNFVYSVESRRLFLIDLDSVQDMRKLPEALQPLQAWRDIASAIYRMVAKLGYPTALDKYTLDNLLAHDPIHAILAGYFTEIPEDELRPVARRLWGYFIPHLFLLKKHAHAIRNEWSGDERKSYKMDHDLFYILALTSLQPLFARSAVGRRYPSPLTQADMFAKAERFLGPRYEYFVWLMGRA
ncbi:MAG: SET domain-containing protein [Salinarimonadaceae bacterium]|nr:MAG: SET domain-containing protein [Salinarimonadaceae bacterium]